MKIFQTTAGAALRMAVAAGALMLSVLGLRADSIRDLPTTRINGKEMYYYDTTPSDNIYIIANKFGITPEFIHDFNPSAADGIKPRMRLFFPADIKTDLPGDSNGPTTHVVGPDESIYGIAERYGMTVDDLYELNPSAMDGIRKGQRLILRADAATEITAVAAASEASASSSAASASVAASAAAASAASEASATAAEESALLSEVDNESASEPAKAASPEREINIAVMLPFLLQEEQMGKQTRLITEFYKGFLLAADTLNLPGRTPVHIHTYDTAASLDTVRALMRRPEMASMDLFLVPDNMAQIEAVSTLAPENALVYNVFAVKDSSYVTNPGMIQTNIPHDEMYERAISAFIDKYSGTTPVFLVRKNGRGDKKEFTDALRKALSAKGIIYRTVNFDNYLGSADIEEYGGDSGRWVFVPESGHRDEFQRVATAVKELREASLDPDAVQMFGYPEWSTFRGTQLDELGQLHATIYTRYAPVQGDAEARALNDRFRSVYGEGMEDRQMPVLGILGFDTGRMIIDGLRTLAGRGEFPEEFTGIQSGMRLARVDGGGLFNDALFFVTYFPGNTTEKTLK